MINQALRSASCSDALKVRKKHLANFLKIFYIKPGKTKTAQALTVNIIKMK